MSVCCMLKAQCVTFLEPVVARQINNFSISIVLRLWSWFHFSSANFYQGKATTVLSIVSWSHIFLIPDIRLKSRNPEQNHILSPLLQLEPLFE